MKRSGPRSRVRRAATAALVLAAREVLLVAGCLFAWSLVPVLLGMTVTTVMSDSMAPGIRAGDVVVARPVTVDQLRDGRVGQGSVLLVDDPDHPGRQRLHRWVGTRGADLVLRGDANAQTDSSPVRPAAVHAVGFLRIPMVGLPVLWVRTGQPGPLALVALALLLAVRFAFPPESRRGPDRPGRGGWRRKAVAAVAAPVAALLLLLLGSSTTGAIFTKTTNNPSDKWTAGAFDCPARTGADFPTPYLYYSYMGYNGTYNSSSESDLALNGATGRLTTTTRRTGTCASGNSPYVTLSTTATYVYQSAPTTGITSPTDLGISAWFRTTSPGGKIAGFGNKGSGNSTVYDRHVYMANDGRLSFGVQMSDGTRITCTTTSVFGDGQWHLVVATYSSASGALTLWTDDGQPACSAVASGTISSYTGFWQFGNDTLSATAWPNASSTSNFVGDLDETGVYASALTLANERAIFAVGH